MRKGFLLSDREAAEIFLVLSTAKIKLFGKAKTLAEKYWKKFELALGLFVDEELTVEDMKNKWFDSINNG